MKWTAAALTAAALLSAAPALAQAPKKPATAGEKKPAANDTQTFYSVGLAIAKSLEVFTLSPPELEQVMKGIRDGASGKVKPELNKEQQAAVNELARGRMAKVQEKESAKAKEAAPAYLTKMGGQKGATKTASGAIVIPTKEGTGAAPAPTDTVKVHYTGKLMDGVVFDSSVQRGEPAEFPLNGVIKCWTEGLQKMKVGGKATIVCPSEIAYGAQGRPPQIPGNAVLTFEVELLDIVKK
jgi:FKBP-type peptidyl-prolyl cis-trans isomerase